MLMDLLAVKEQLEKRYVETYIVNEVDLGISELCIK